MEQPWQIKQTAASFAGDWKAAVDDRLGRRPAVEPPAEATPVDLHVRNRDAGVSKAGQVRRFRWSHDDHRPTSGRDLSQRGLG